MSAPNPTKKPDDDSGRPTGFTGEQKLIAAIAASAIVLFACLFSCTISAWYMWDLGAQGKAELAARQGPAGDAGFGIGPGKGAGPDVKPKDKEAFDSKEKKPDQADKKPARALVEIEILGGARFTGEDRFFLIRNSDPGFKFASMPLSLKELEPTLKDNREKIEIKILHTDESAFLDNELDPTRRLQNLAQKHGIPTRTP